MKYLLKLTLLITAGVILTGCNSASKGKSTLTGWNFNDPRYGNYLKGKTFGGQDAPGGMVAIEGGTFTMGQVQDDVMFDWNTTPQTMHVRSFYMDESEVTNSEYLLYLQVTKDVFPPSEEKYKHIYNAALPDTLVWRKSLGNTDLLSENYLRHPAYADYPVVGVSYLQAVQYCKWRTNAVNIKRLIDRGVLKNVLAVDTIRNYFDTDVYLENPKLLFKGDSTVYKRGLPDNKVRQRGQPKPPKGSFTGRQVTSADGILAQKFRLPTEAEWEYAAKSVIENREYNTIRGRKKYAWNGKYTRDKSKRYKGDHLANFKQSKGDYSGLAGWSTDGSDIPIKVKSYPPNAFGLYDMSGNVSEWVADVYRPIIDAEANDFNYFRGNIFTKKLIGEDGKVVIVGDSNNALVEYDTLPDGKIIPKNLPGTIKYVPQTKDETYMRRNYRVSDNVNKNDGDRNSTRHFEEDEDRFASKARMYNSPLKPENDIDVDTGRKIKKYDEAKRTTLISNQTRVVKGGSWNDREYWLDPSQRRYLPEYMSANYIGFRCVSDIVGPLTFKKRKARNPSRN
ncbi:protein involved in gliding motility GldJ [Lutibacter sp. Hel_I_33_5]|uniref:gliding motility lipoprotein GldJ n=1 Tax=Lutibacter sp. Hel_I_33_5 TaxID=1566289 RepID=UPI0011A9C6B0|nr:gliding motility lipoprotein GldJ [Lutibacter sp. Hel_I_33_5]TVZ55481.1 protein involved in gliding motility GldJ [Lutibacter sp. Hel_I_33_5]